MKVSASLHRLRVLAIASLVTSLLITVGSYFVHSGKSSTNCPEQQGAICVLLQQGCDVCAGGIPSPLSHGYPYSYADAWSTGNEPTFSSKEVTEFQPLFALFDLGIWFVVSFALIGLIDFQVRRSWRKQKAIK